MYKVTSNVTLFSLSHYRFGSSVEFDIGHRGRLLDAVANRTQREREKSDHSQDVKPVIEGRLRSRFLAWTALGLGAANLSTGLLSTGRL